MGIIAKFTLKNILEKRFRTLLILGSIIIATALFFASSAISNTLNKMFTEKLMQQYGKSEIIITPNSKSPSNFFSTFNAEAFRNRTEYIVGAIQTSAVYKWNNNNSVNIALIGMDLNDLKKMNPIIFFEPNTMDEISDNNMIISKTTAEKYHLSIGNTLELNLQGVNTKFLIAGISQPTGPFSNEGQTICAIVPKYKLSSIFHAKGRVNAVYIKLINLTEKNTIMKALSKVYDKYDVKETITKEELKNQQGSLSTSLFFMSITVFFISVFIIYSSFKVVAIERLPAIGTIRSVGATKRMMNLVLFIESSLYGICGGLFGCGFGLVILYIIAYISRPSDYGRLNITVSFTLLQVLGAFLIAIALSIGSSIFPILAVSKIPVKDIVLNSLVKINSKKKLKLILSLIFFVSTVIIPQIVPKKVAIPVDVLCMIISVASIVLIVPYLTNAVTKVLGKLYVQIFKNEGILAAQNLRDNVSTFNSIILLTIGISSLLVINIVSVSVVKEVINLYKNYKFDISMHYPEANRNFIELLSQVEGVSSVYGDYQAYKVEVVGKSSRISILNGIDSKKYLQYWDMKFENTEPMDQLDSDRFIILSNKLKDRLNVKKGDMLTLKLPCGERAYKVVGYINTLMNMGDYALTSDRFLKLDTGNKFYSNIYIKTSKDPKTTESLIRSKFNKTSFWSSTVQNQEKENLASNAQLVTILKSFSIIALIIGIFGVLNNQLISFMERKRSFAVLRSIGMNKVQIVKMIFIEALTGGILGGVFGIIAGFVLLFIVSCVLKDKSYNIELHYSISQFVYSLFGGIIITILASISPALKSSKLNIIESIKYE